MSDVKVDMAAIPAVKGELTTTGHSAGDQANQIDPTAARRIRLVAVIATFMWLAACGIYLYMISTSGALSGLPEAHVVVYTLAVILPTLAVWLVAFNMMQAQELRQATALMNDSFLAMTYPTDQAHVRVAKVVESLSDQATALNAASERARAQTEAMENLFRKQADMLRIASDIAEERAKRVETMLGGRNSELETISQTLAERADAVQAIIADGTLKLASASAEATERTRVAHNILKNRAEDLLTAAEQTATRTDDISDHYAAIIRNLDDSTLAARQQAEAVSQEYQAQIDAMSVATDDLAGRTRLIADVIKREVDSLEGASEKAAHRAGQIEKAVESHAENMNLIVEDTHKWVSQTADYFAAQASFMQDTANEAVHSIHGQVDEAVHHVGTASRDFLSKTAAIGAKAGEVADRMTQAGLRLQQSAADTSDAWREAADTATEQVNHAAQSFQNRSDDMRRVAATAAKSISDASKQARQHVYDDAEAVAAIAQDATTQTDGLRQSLQQTSADVLSASAKTAEALQGQRDDLIRHGTTLAETADSAITKAETLGTIYKQETERMAAATRQTDADIDVLRQTIEAAAAALHAAVHNMDETTHGVERSLTRQTSTVNDATHHATMEAQKIERAFAAAAGGLVDAADTTQRQLRGSSQDILAQIQSLQTISHEGLKTLGDYTATMERSAQAVGNHTETAVNRLTALRETLDEHDAHAALNSEKATERLMSVSEILEIVSTKLTALAEETVQNIKASATGLEHQAVGVSENAEKAVALMIEGGKKLEKRAGRLAERADATVRSLHQAGEGFEKSSGELVLGTQAFRAQTDVIVRGAQEIIAAAEAVSTQAGKADETFAVRAENLTAKANALADQIERMEEMDRTATQGAFIKTANNIMESLGSLAIDLDRVLEAEISDQVWKQYQAGDTSAFARRLLKIAGPSARDQIAQHYKADSIFRDQVTRYVRQFEGMLGTAMSNERTDALAGTLLSSSMGKLYVVLAQSINRLH